MKKYNFLSGLPRSGSTLLATLLNQNPRIHSSATSALLDLLVAQAIAVQNNRTLYEITDKQEIDLYNGMIESYYKDINKDIIIDKHRAWPNLIGALSKMGIDSKIICTNRPVADIITSYITLIEKNPTIPNFIDNLILSRNQEINIHTRSMTIWNDYVGIPHTVLKNAVKNNRNNLLFVNYDDIIVEPNAVLNKIESFIGVEHYVGYNFNDIINTQPEKDEIGWGLKGLHDIRPELKKVSKSSEEVIGKELTNYFNQFSIIME